MLIKKKLITLNRYFVIITSDRPKFGSGPVPAEIGTGTEIPVSVPAISEILVLAEISVQMLAEILHNFWIL